MPRVQLYQKTERPREGFTVTPTNVLLRWSQLMQKTAAPDADCMTQYASVLYHQDELVPRVTPRCVEQLSTELPNDRQMSMIVLDRKLMNKSEYGWTCLNMNEHKCT